MIVNSTDISRAIAEQVRWICTRMMRTSAEARRILRIEMTYEARDALLYGLREFTLQQELTPNPRRHGPETFESVDLYVVERLPEPGWYVINPMAPAKR